MRLLLTGGSGFIGTNIVEQYSKAKGVTLTNVDIAKPMNPDQARFWHDVDIMDSRRLEDCIVEFQPTTVVHLAARTDCDENTTVEEGYAVNTQGTLNLLNALRAVDRLETLVVVSTQFVLGPGVDHESEWRYQPHTVYGESKCQMERLVRDQNLPCNWFIVRPTNIWGPWHLRYKNEFWRTVQSGFYFHPGGPPVIRTYGYVKNVIWQIFRLIDMPSTDVRGKAFYVGDDAGDIYQWTNAFSLALTGRPARRIPRLFLYMLALTGSMCSVAGLRVPMTLSRYASMTTDYRSSIDETTNLVGKAPFTLQMGVKETVDWLRRAS